MLLSATAASTHDDTGVLVTFPRINEAAGTDLDDSLNKLVGGQSDSQWAILIPPQTEDGALDLI
jgi:hypothetical protein